VRHSLKYLLVSGVLFEELGFKYFGPVDGHNLPQLIDTLKQAEKVNGPVMVHVVTLKGKGYSHAEANSMIWHGLGTYKIESGEVVKSAGPPMYTDVFGQALIELAEKDERIIAVTPAMPSGSGLIKFGQKFPSRMIDVGIAEQHAATMCAALASEGMKPVFAVYSTFLQRAYDQVVHDICRQNLNVVFAIDRAGFVGPDGETHQGIYDIAFLRHIPNMVLMMPKDENELRQMMKTALDYNDGPIAVRYPRINGTGAAIDEVLRPLPIGTWDIVREGEAIAVLAVGPMVQIAEEAADLLKTQGILLQVINARFIKPLDEALLLKLANERTQLITMEETALLGGFGSAVQEFYAQKEIYGMQIKSLGIPDYFVEHGSIKEQRAEVGLTVDNLNQQVKTMMPRKRQRA
jgi:1-deoxy-D-xylulose-5-phosphate synthase